MSASHHPDPRMMGKVKLDPSSAAAVSSSFRIPTDLLLALLLNKTLLASSALLVKTWLSTAHSESIHSPAADSDDTISIFSGAGVHDEGQGNSSWAIATVAFALAALGQTLWFRVWEWLPAVQRVDKRRLAMLSAIMFAQLLCWLLAVSRLSPLNVIIFTQYSEIWATDLAKSMRGKSYGGYTILLAMAVSFLTSVTSQAPVYASSMHASAFDDEDLPESLRKASSHQIYAAEASAASYSVMAVLMGHLYLGLYALATVEKERALLSASRDTGGRRRAGVVATVVAATVSVPVSLFGKLVGFETLPSLDSLSPSFSTSSSSASGHLPAFLALALSFLVLEPLVSTALEPHASVRSRVTHGWPITVLACVTIGYVGFGIRTSWSQLVVALLVGLGLRTILKTTPEYKSRFQGSTNGTADSGEPNGTQHSEADVSSLQELMASLRVGMIATRHYIRVIMANPDSRKIFQFLCLNLAFMGVQLLWGVWTNSLGLISDAIHMFFDCAAIGMGLFASVMATWKNDSTFTYGYGRVETLSGFANGVFLILISIFIVFEAIQRIIEPPVMNNNVQLLIVSSMGLGVNLFGMFAMGGHHHHHHGHSHGHGHDHHHHGHGHGHDHGHDHGHSHNMMGVYLHVMADTLGSVGVIISTLLIEKFGWTGFDPIASLFIAILIVLSVIPLVLEAGRILCLDMGEEHEKAVIEALQELKTIDGLASFSSPRFWPKDAGTLVGTIRIQVASAPEASARRVEKLLKARISGLESVSVQVERLTTASPINGSPIASR